MAAETKVLTAQEEERHRMTLEALDDVDAGRVIDHQAIQAWADGLGTHEEQDAVDLVRSMRDSDRY